MHQSADGRCGMRAVRDVISDYPKLVHFRLGSRGEDSFQRDVVAVDV
ncbi:MAG: hypothetical protein WKF76_07220 [Nocardioidaceae bacterium]